MCCSLTDSTCPGASAAGGASTPASTRTTSRKDPQVHWISGPSVREGRKIRRPRSTPETYYNPEKVPEAGLFLHAGPVPAVRATRPASRPARSQATWKEPDGIVVVDYNWCIGCRYCMAACPYGARRFNWAEPKLPAEELNPNTHYLGNRPRPKGVVEKCTFCIQRTRERQLPRLRRGLPGRARASSATCSIPSSEIR
ncbi:MAG: 4Fe-4S dicluster domain-containing protein [Desulfomicrobium escambiense]|nr:4Fe-4S dicluster domain-containing protein [Desulfomicrobium escambiense]